MLQKVIAILLVIAAVVGLALYVRKERKSDACNCGCAGCPLAQKCKTEGKRSHSDCPKHSGCTKE